MIEHFIAFPFEYLYYFLCHNYATLT